ncbi:MAG: MATE family efflux transporter, partial [Lentisphaeraceae bacterium]|nr:MATE family efflux transporter [Lentisphaeraceae bacterium]
MKELLNKDFLRLAVPNILANLAVPLLSLTDTVLMGHSADIAGLGAVAIAAQVFTCLYWSFGFLRMGTTGLTAQAYGRQEGEGLVLGRGLICATLLGLVILTLQYPLELLSFRLLNLGPELETTAREYFQVRIFAAPATLALYVMHGWFLGMQKSWLPVILTFTGNGVNIILSIIFVRHFDMGAEGIAWGTLISQYSNLLIALLLLLRFKKCLLKTQWNHVLEKGGLKSFLAVNRDLFIRTTALLAVVSSFTFLGKFYGAVVLGANAILLNLSACLAYVVDGLAFAAESLTGRYLGEGRIDDIKKVSKQGMKWSLVCGVIFAVVLFVGSDQVLSLMTSQEAILEQAKVYYPWVLLALMINPIPFMLDGVFIGISATKAMMRIMLVCTFLVYLPCLFLFQSWGNHGLWLSMSIFMFMLGVLMTLAQKVV